MEERQLEREQQKRHIEQRFKKLKWALEDLIARDDFLRVMKEVSALQSIDDARCFDNSLAMAYNNGRRSVMVEIKGIFTAEQWQKIMEFELDERNPASK